MKNDMEIIAARIRKWRDEANLTLQELADRAGVSASTIHKVENNQTVPTLTVFLKIAQGLGRPPTDLLASESQSDYVSFTRVGDRTTVRDMEGTRVEKIVEDLIDPQIEMWRTVIQPGIGSDEGLIQEDGEMIILCQEGELTVWIEDQEYTLTEGDALHSKAFMPKRWLNSGDVPAAALMAMNLPTRITARAQDRIRNIIRKRGRDQDVGK